MGVFSVGSIAHNVNLFVENLPSSISGTPLTDLAERKMQLVADWTGATLSTTSIPLAYQSPILNLTIADVLKSMALIGADVASISLGDFSVNKGGGESNLMASSMKFHEVGMEELRNLGKASKFSKGYGV